MWRRDAAMVLRAGVRAVSASAPKTGNRSQKSVRPYMVLRSARKTVFVGNITFLHTYYNSYVVFIYIALLVCNRGCCYRGVNVRATASYPEVRHG